MEVKLTLSTSEHKELISYCNLNDLLISEVVKKSYITGFNIERYGLLNSGLNEKEVVKEVEKIVEVPVEIIKEVIKEVPSPPIEVKVIEYVDREVIKEVPVEKLVSNIDKICDNSKIEELEKKIQELQSQPPQIIEVVKDSNLQPKIDALQNTIQKMRQDLIEKDKKIQEYELIISECRKQQEDKKGMFLRGSNLDDNLYK